MRSKRSLQAVQRACTVRLRQGVAMSQTRIGRRPLLTGAVASGASAVLPSLGFAQTKREGSAMASDLTAEEIVRLLDLQPNATCGFVRVTFLSKQAVAPGGLPQPFAEGRPLGSA
jgi:hypothetical protein